MGFYSLPAVELGGWANLTAYRNILRQYLNAENAEFEK